VLAADGHSCNDVNECGIANGGCAQTCTNSSGSFTCSCSAGYMLNMDGHSCDDVNECAMANGGCAQICNNLAGSFTCVCSSGYALDADGHTCTPVTNGGADAGTMTDGGTAPSDGGTSAPDASPSTGADAGMTMVDHHGGCGVAPGGAPRATSFLWASALLLIVLAARSRRSGRQRC
jgi:MYXO-CTERM domain-containing protein